MPKTITASQRYMPLILTLCIIAADQVTKALVVALVPEGTIAWSLGGEIFRLIHTRNTGIAFSIGRDSPDFLRVLLFTVVPIVVMGAILVYFLRSRELSRLQRWAVAGILGGGIGNIIDRIFRPHGVVDFLDFKFWGLFGLDRWPTFNVADSSVVVCGIVLFLSLLFQRSPKNE